MYKLVITFFYNFKLTKFSLNYKQEQLSKYKKRSHFTILSADVSNSNESDTEAYNYDIILVNDLNKIGYTINSNPNDIWKSLNKCCHKNFGSEEHIKESTKPEDLQWAAKTLPSYTIWDKFSQYHLLVELWINKVNAVLKKKEKESKNLSNSKILTYLLYYLY